VGEAAASLTKKNNYTKCIFEALINKMKNNILLLRILFLPFVLFSQNKTPFLQQLQKTATETATNHWRLRWHARRGFFFPKKTRLS
jgi:hypothetical protein